MIFTIEQLWLTNLFWSSRGGCIPKQLSICIYGWHKIHIVHSNVWWKEMEKGSKRPAEATYSQGSTLSYTQLAPAVALQIPTEILNLFYKVNKMQIRLCINAMPTSKIQHKCKRNTKKNHICVSTLATQIANTYLQPPTSPSAHHTCDTPSRSSDAAWLQLDFTTARCKRVVGGQTLLPPLSNSQHLTQLQRVLSNREILLSQVTT